MGPDHINAFSKRIRFRLNQNVVKNFDFTSLFVFLSTLMRFNSKTEPFRRVFAFRPHYNAQKCWWKRQYMGSWYDAFFVIVFASLHFHLYSLKRERYPNTSLSKPFSKTSCFHRRFGCLWTINENASKSMRFWGKTHSCSRDITATTEVWPTPLK